MKKISLAIICLALFTLLLAAVQPDVSRKERPLYASDRIKLKLTPEAELGCRLPVAAYAETPSFQNFALDGIFRQCGGMSVIRAHIPLKDKVWEKRSGFDRWYIVKLSGKTSVEKALALFQKSPLVETAIPEYYAYLHVVPNDTYYANNWGHNNTAQLPAYQGGSHSGPGVGTIGFDSDAQLAWDQGQGYGSQATIIAILDTGVDLVHPDLRLVTGYDYGDNDGNPQDDSAENGHGTCTSGIAAAKANNALGITGVAGNCSVMPLKVITSAGDITYTAIENALAHAADNGASVGSMSFGGGSSTTAMDDALAYAYNHGVVLFASSGNGNASTVSYPARNENVISVGAASPTGQRKNTSSSDGENWWGSNYGQNTQDAPNSIDLMAPTILPATDISGTGGYSSNDYFMWFNGTSCSCPYAAGVAALVKSKDPTLTPDQIRTILTTTATDMTFDGGAGWDRYTGYGLVNANDALTAVTPGMPFCNITSPDPNSVFELGNNIEITVSATDPGRSVSSVQFFLDDSSEPAATDTDSPYSWTWNTTGYAMGDHIIKAVVTDDLDNSASTQISISLVMPADEGFESGDLSSLFWYSTGDSPWTVQNSQVFYGSYSAQSGGITANQSSELSVRLNITTAGELSFYKKVSSSAQHGVLKFLLDGAQMAEWSGELNWSFSSYPVTSGVHTFSWRYVRDSNANAGSDCAWLDQIILPQHSTYYWEPQNAQATGGNKIVLIRWQAPQTGIPLSYKVMRDGNLLYTTSLLTCTDMEVENGTTYNYSIIAVYATGESAPCQTASATPIAVTVTAVEIGNGTNATTANDASPINISYRALHGQSVYLASELNAMGIYGPIYITSLGFYIDQAPTLSLCRFLIRLKHTTATNVSTWQNNTNLQTALYKETYAPVAGGYQMLTFDTPFYWNGMDNLLLDTAFGVLSANLPGGSVRYTNVADGYRYARSNSLNQAEVYYGGMTSVYRPNIRIGVSVIQTDPEISVNATNLTFGNVLPGYSAAKTFNISNPGARPLQGEISYPEGFLVSQSGSEGLLRDDPLPFTVLPDSTTTFVVTFMPGNPGSYAGNIAITHNAESATVQIGVSGNCTAALSAPFIETFESGINDWNAMDGGQTNRWFRGGAASQTGAQALYISQDNGLTNTYNFSSRSISHLVRDITLPAGSDSLKLRFAWRAKGEGTSPYFDFLRVYLLSPMDSPNPGELLISGQLGGSLNQHDTWQEAALDIPQSCNGQTKRFVFTWVNDSQLGNQPPAALDNIRIIIGNQNDLAVVMTDSLFCNLPAVNIPGVGAVQAAVSFSGISPIAPCVNIVSGHNSLSEPLAGSGLDFRISGADFRGANIVFDHNLGYKPAFMGYKIGSEGQWLYQTPAPNWTATRAFFTIPDSYASAEEVSFCFADPSPVLPPWLPSFTALVNSANDVDLTWGNDMVAFDPGFTGFSLWRGTTNALSGATKLTAYLPVVAGLETYVWTDSTTAEQTRYYYWLECQKSDDTTNFMGPISIYTGTDPVPPAPKVSGLLGNFPNPFNPLTEIRYGLAAPSGVEFAIYNQRGQVVRKYNFSHALAGYYKFKFDGRDKNGRALASGVYYIRMSSGNHTWLQKMLLMR